MTEGVVTIPVPPPPPATPWSTLSGPQSAVTVCRKAGPEGCPKADSLALALEEAARRFGVDGLTIGRSKAACSRGCADGPFVAVPGRSVFMSRVRPDWIEPIIFETLIAGRLLFPLLRIDRHQSIHPRLLFDRRQEVLVVMDEEACMVQVARYMIRFHEGMSCGKCVPCRLGVTRLTEIVDALTVGTVDEATFDEARRLFDTMQEASYCEFAGKVSFPVRLVLQDWREEFLTHITDRFCPARVCPLHYRR